MLVIKLENGTVTQGEEQPHNPEKTGKPNTQDNAKKAEMQKYHNSLPQMTEQTRTRDHTQKYNYNYKRSLDIIECGVVNDEIPVVKVDVVLHIMQGLRQLSCR